MLPPPEPAAPNLPAAIRGSLLAGQLTCFSTEKSSLWGSAKYTLFVRRPAKKSVGEDPTTTAVNLGSVLGSVAEKRIDEPVKGFRTRTARGVPLAARTRRPPVVAVTKA